MGSISCLKALISWSFKSPRLTITRLTAAKIVLLQYFFVDNSGVLAVFSPVGQPADASPHHSLVFLSCSNTLAVNSSALAAEEEFAEHMLAAVLTPTYGGALSGPAGACPPAGKPPPDGH